MLDASRESSRDETPRQRNGAQGVPTRQRVPPMRDPFIRPLPVQKIQPHNTALLVIDMEHDFVEAGAVQETPGGRALIPTINRLGAWARSHGVPVIFTLEAHRPDHADYGIEL